jgi:hypothetical protein
VNKTKVKISLKMLKVTIILGFYSLFKGINTKPEATRAARRERGGRGGTGGEFLLLES